MANKSVLFIIPWLAVGGLERMQVTLANALSRKGYSVTVMTLNPEDALRNELNKNVEFIYIPPKSHIGNHIPYIRHKFYDDGMWETRATPKQLYQYYVGNRKFDVEIGFFRGLSVKIISGSTNPDSVKLAWVHSDFKRCAGITNNFHDLEEVKKAYSEFDKIVCVSNQAKSGFEEIIGFSYKTTTIYNMLPVNDICRLSAESCPIQKEKFCFLSVGHLVDIKGYDRLFAVAKRLFDEGYAFDLWIVGEGTEREKLQKYIDDHHLTDVKLLGQQSNPYCFMKQADLYVCSSRFEGYNLTVAEALICGCPVLSTECTGPTEILDEGRYGILVENNEKGLYNGMKSVLDNPRLLSEYRRKAQERLDFFNEDRIMNQIEMLFSE